MLNSTNVGDGDYFHTFWQEDIHCRFSHATIAAMCSPLYLVWLGLTMSGSALVRIGLIVVGLILCRLFKPISNLFDKDFKIF